MVASRYKIVQGVRLLKPDTLVFLALAAWWVLNLLQAAFTGLADDEGYYWYFSQHLDWGYFDHPPMVALLVWLSSWLPGGLGVRFFSTLLQPLYLWLFWRLIRPSDATRRDAVAYFLICFSQPLLQLYGFLAVPDAPLLMFTVLFLWAYKRFLDRGNMLNATLMGLSVALLGYSKYHGALVVALVLLSNPRLFRRWQLWFAGLVALVLFLPHLWWQYGHDWVSFRYHLVDRNAWEYSPAFTFEFIGTLLVLFNPLWLYHYGKGLCRRESQLDDNGRSFRRSLLFLLCGFLLFFLLSTFRGRVQAQWVLPVVFPLVALLFAAGRRSRYVHVAGWVVFGLFLAVRLVVMVNPFDLKGEVFNQPAKYRAIAQMANGRPVQFNSYTAAAKYAYYTGQPSYCTPFYYYRQSQWMYDTSDRAFNGRETVLAGYGEIGGDTLHLPDGTMLTYRPMPSYTPTRELQVECLTPIDFALPYLHGDDTSRLTYRLDPLTLRLAVSNPYSYDICPSAEHPVWVWFYFHVRQHVSLYANSLLADTLRAGTVTVIDQPLVFQRALAAKMPDGEHITGFAIGRLGVAPPQCSPKFRTLVANGPDTLHITLP